MLHVLHVHDRLSLRGGADIHLFSLLTSGARGHRASLAVGRRDPGVRAPEGVDLHLVRGVGGREREAARAAQGLQRTLDFTKPDLVHVHNVLQPAVLRALARWGPVVATIQDHRSFCPGRGRVLPDGQPCTAIPGPGRCAACFEDREYSDFIQRACTARMQALRGFQRWIVLSDYMAAELEAAGLDRGRIRVVPPFPWFAEPPAPPPAGLPAGPWILGAGRLVWAKGFHVLVQAYTRSGCQLPLVLAGEGAASDDLRSMARERGLLRRTPAPGGRGVWFTGWVQHGQLQSLLAAARCLVLPSLWAEPFGIIGLEALSLGVPVAASAVGGVGDWLGPEHGWLLPPGDSASLALALEEAHYAEACAQKGARGRASCLARFHPRALMRRLEAVYDAALTA